MKDIEAQKDCPICNGSGQYCTGNSGSDSDGNAPILERCECYLDNAKALQGDAGDPVDASKIAHNYIRAIIERESKAGEMFPQVAEEHREARKRYIKVLESIAFYSNRNLIETRYYTSPPNTQARLDKAIEALEEVREVYAGMDGFKAETAPEAYLQRIIKSMYEIVRESLKTIGS